MKSAIIGCGGIAQVHGEVLSKMDDAELVAFADIKPERARAMAEKFGGRAYGSIEELLDHEQVDVAHLCTPHYLHTPMAQLCAGRGVHVFTEKPPVIDRAQWEAFRSLEGRVRVGVCFQNRYNKTVQVLREHLAEAGRLLGARAFVTWRREAPYYTESGWRGALSTEGGGALINQSIHTLDLMVQFMGPAASVEASVQNHHLKGVIEVEDTLEAYIDFGGARGLFYCTTAHCADSPVLLELVCENGTLRVEGDEVTLRWKDGRVERISAPTAGESDAGKAYWGNSHGLCIRDFYRCVREGTPFRNDIAGVADTVGLMLDIYDSARA